MPIIKSSARQKYHCQMFLKIPKQSYPVSFRWKTLLRIFVMTSLNLSNMRTNLKILNENKPKKLAKFTHKSTVAAKELKREAEKQNIPFRKIANPPNTRWSGRLKNLSSVQHLQKPLINLPPLWACVNPKHVCSLPNVIFLT